jgi:hypothetical protein
VCVKEEKKEEVGRKEGRRAMIEVRSVTNER